MKIDEIIQNVLKDAVKELEKINTYKKGTRKRRNKIDILEGQQEEDNLDNSINEKTKDLFQYTSIRNYNWFINFINRREHRELMSTKQGKTYLVFNKENYKLVLTYNTETSEVNSTFDLSTITGLQKAKK